MAKNLRIEILGIIVAGFWWVAPGSAHADFNSLSPEDQARVLFSIRGDLHRVKPAFEWVNPKGGAVLLGFTHVMNSGVPASLSAQLGAFKSAGVTDLLLETPQKSEDCRQFLESAKGALEGDEQAAFLKKWEIVYGADYFLLLRQAQAQGVDVRCGERPEYADQDGGVYFHDRNEFLAWEIHNLLEAGHRPLLLVGAYHLNPVNEILKWLGNSDTSLFHASEVDGRFLPSEGLMFPDLTQMLGNFSSVVNYKANSVQRDVDADFSTLKAKYPAGEFGVSWGR